MRSDKTMRLNYELTERKLLSAVEKIISSDNEISIRRVAELAGVSISTAYKHNCTEMIRMALDKRESPY